MPGGPTTFTTPPRPPIARSTMASTAAISQRRPTRRDSVPPAGHGAARSPAAGALRRGRRLPLIDTTPVSARTAVCSTKSAVDSLSITPPGGATDSIRCANPTCSPIAAYPDTPRTDFTGNNPARIQTHPQPQIHAVTAPHLSRQPVRLLLDGQRRQARPDRMILQRHRRPEQRHQAITGELRHRAAVPAHHRRARPRPARP